MTAMVIKKPHPSWIDKYFTEPLYHFFIKPFDDWVILPSEMLASMIWQGTEFLAKKITLDLLDAIIYVVVENVTKLLINS